MKISCKYCNTQVKINKNKIFMNCMCDEDIRIIDLKELHLHENYLCLENKQDYLYLDKENKKICQEYI